MKLYRPVRTNKLTQGFGENLACASTHISGLPRLPFVVTGIPKGQKCPQGSRPLYPLIGLKGHNGYDHATWHGEPVYHSADFDGWMKTEHDKDGGIGVDVVSDKPVLKCTEPTCDDVHYVKMRYWHGLSVIGYDHKPVKPGEMIMKADSSGTSSGDHVHWAPKWCDADGKGIHTGNGYQGAFDPTPYYIDSPTILESPALAVSDCVSRIKFLLITLLDTQKMLYNKSGRI